MSDKEEFSQMENNDFSDSQLVHHFRGVLVAVTTVSYSRKEKLPRVLLNSMLMFPIVEENIIWIVVAQGDRENYDELVGYLHPKKHLNPDEVAILVVGS